MSPTPDEPPTLDDIRRAAEFAEVAAELTEGHGWIVDVGKLVVIVTVIVSAAVLLAIGAISEAAGVGAIMGAMGYTFGNGRLAQKRRIPQPMIRRQ